MIYRQQKTITVNFADDIAILATHEEPTMASVKLSDNVTKINESE
jgi:hypothetical protein